MGKAVYEKKIFKDEWGQNSKILPDFHIFDFYGKMTIPADFGQMIKVVEHDLGFLRKFGKKF